LSQETRIRPGLKIFEVSALTVLQYFDTVGSVTSGMYEPLPFITKGSLPEQLEEENRQGTG